MTLIYNKEVFFKAEGNLLHFHYQDPRGGMDSSNGTGKFHRVTVALAFDVHTDRERRMLAPQFS